MLAELYASDVTQYLDKAVKAQTQILRREPVPRGELQAPPPALHRGEAADPAWCLCQALSVLNLAEPDEERFYRRHRGDNAAAAQAVLDEEDWTARIAHDDADPLLTRIFAIIQPTIIRARTQPLEALGYGLALRASTSRAPVPGVADALLRAGRPRLRGAAGVPEPERPGGSRVPPRAHARRSSSARGVRAPGADAVARVRRRSPPHVLPARATTCGTSCRPAPASRRGSSPRSSCASRSSRSAPDLQGQVNEALAVMTPDFHGRCSASSSRARSRSSSSRAARIDLKKWVAAVDLTADRAGFLLAHDLGGRRAGHARDRGRRRACSSKERIKEIVLFSISEEYLQLRERLRDHDRLLTDSFDGRPRGRQ